MNQPSIQDLEATPREVQVRSGQERMPQEHGLAFFLLLPHTWLGIWLAAFYIFQLSLLGFGHVVIGRVTQLKPWRSSSGYNVAYEYFDGGRNHEGTGAASWENGSRVTVGAPVKVKVIHVAGITEDYLAEFGTFWPLDKLIIIGLGVVFWNTVVFVMFRRSYLLPRRQRRLLAEGMVVRGMIARVEEVTGRRAGDRKVKYAYETADGRAFEGKIVVTRERLADLTDVTVFYSPRKPWQNVAMELSPYSVAGAEEQESARAVMTAESHAAKAPQRTAAQGEQRISLPPPPRSVRRRSGMPLAVALPLFLLASMAWLAFGIARDVAGGILLNACGIQTSGVVLSKTVDSQRGAKFYVTYHYHERTSDFTGRDQVSERAWNRLPPPGGAVQVKSLHVLGMGGSRIVGAESPSTSRACPLAFGMLCNAIFAAYFVTWAVGVRRRRWLVASGEAAIGQVTAKRVGRGKRANYETEYFYVTKDGRRCCGLWSTTHEAEDRQLPLGREVVVLYSRSNPGWGSVLHGFSEFIVAED
jgi:hypothetical protein